MKFLFKILFLSILLPIYNLKAQSPSVIEQTNVQELNRLSKQWRQERDAQMILARQKAEELGLELRQVFEDGTIIELQGLDERGNLMFYITGNRDAARTISADKLYSGGGLGLTLNGSSMTAGEWDGGAVRGTHQELVNRVTQVDSSTSIADHATHVAGTIIASGVDSSARGMAYGASLDAYDWTNDDAEMASAAANGLLISNHSYGSITGWYYDGSNYAWWGDTTLSANQDYRFGFYNSQSAAWDQIARNAPYYLIVKSAGNDRGDTGSASHYLPLHSNALSTTPRNADGGPLGYDCISTYSGAKNILTIGAVNAIPAGYSGPSSVVMSSFSGWGPTDDGRIKPDLVANGVGVYSSLGSSNTAYASWNGTSMASPSATGALLLLQEHYYDENNAYMKAATLKALAIHTADEAGTSIGPDYQHGWGLINAAKAAQHISDTTGTKSITETNISNGNTYSFGITVNGFSPIRATIAWTDVAGTPVSASLNPTSPMLVNDLDIRIIRNSDSTYYYPYILNPASPSSAASTGDNFRDNVEQIYIASPSAGSYTVIVSHKGTLAGGSSQDFSIIIDGGIPPLQPLTCAGVITAPAYWNFDTLTNCSSTAGAACVIPTWYGWQNDTLDNIDWTVNNATTTSTGTGPSTDYNTGTSSGKYLYTEASTSGTGFPNKEAILYSPCISLDSMQNSELAFAYHMSGTTMGSLSVEIYNGYGWSQLWTRSGDLDTLWHVAQVDISNYDGDTVQIRFVGVTGSNYLSDMAIDAVEIREFESCPGSNNFSVSNITDTTAVFAWSSNASFWKIRLDIKDSITVIPPSTINFNPVLFSGLIPSTTYEIYLQDSCGANDTSAWAGPITFTTTGPIQNPTPCGMGAGIPDNTCPSLVYLPFEVDYPGTQLGLDAFLSEVKVIIAHTYDGDIQFSLASPGGDTVALSVFNGGAGDNYGNPSDTACDQTTTFTMSATNSISSGTAPFIGSYLPQGNFSDFYNGSDPNGTWKFIICDGASGDIGSLEFVELVFDSIAPSVNLSCSFVVDSFPSIWDFDTLANCSSTSGSSCPIPSWYGWSNDSTDNIDWTVFSGSTPSTTTGPTRDYTLGNGQGKYLYTEASTSGSGFPGKQAILNSPCFHLTGLTSPELAFGYHMSGSSMGSLSVEVSNGGLYSQVWNLSGNQDTSWHEARVDLSAYIDDTIQLKIVGITGNNYWSDMAIDGIEIREELPCSDPTNPLVYNITDSTANFSWSSNASYWRIRLDIKDSITVIPPTTINFNPVFFFNLLSNTIYEIYIQDSCGNGDTSNWVGPIAFSTALCVSDTVTISSEDNDTICAGTSSILYSSGPDSSTTQWYRDGVLLTGETADTIVASLPGRYNVLYSQAGGCLDSAILGYVLYVKALPNANVLLVGSDSLCQGDSSQLMAAVGYSYQWIKNGQVLSGANSQMYYAKTSGKFNIMLTDSNFCSDTAATGQDIVVFAIPSPGISGSATICEGNQSILRTSGGSSYQWYRNGITIAGASYDSLVVDSAGRYNVMVSALPGCEDSSSSGFNISVFPTPKFSITNNNPNVRCLGDTVSLNSGPFGYAYQWYRNGVLIAGATDKDFGAYQSGSYRALITSVDNCSDSSLSPLVVSLSPRPMPTFTTSNGKNAFCIGDNIIISTPTNSAYQWFKNGSPLFGQSTASLTVADSGNYNVYVSDSNSCSDSAGAGIFIRIDPLPNVIINNSGSSAICQGTFAPLSTSIAGTYQWYNNGSAISGGNASTHNATISGNYNVFVTDTNSCADSSSNPVNITVKALPLVSITNLGSSSMCSGDSTILVSSSSASYQWYKNGSVLSGENNDSLLVTTSGNYNVYATDTASCSDSASTGTQITVNPLPNVVINTSGPTTFCSSDSLVLSTSGGGTYQWYNNAVVITGATSSAYNVTSSGSYNVIVTDANLCSDSAVNPISSVVNPSPVVSISSATLPVFCFGDSTRLTTVSGSSYQWYKDGNLINGATDSTYLALDSGQYNVVVTGSNACSDSATSPFAVTVHSLPNVNITIIGDSVFCDGDSAILNVSNLNSQYQWYQNGMMIPSQNAQNLIVRISASYNVYVTNQNNCSDSARIARLISVNPLPLVVISANDSTLCDGDTAVISANSGFAYSWRRNGIPIMGSSAQSIEVTTPGVYNVVLTNSNFCSDTAALPILIRVFDLPIVSLDSQPELCNTQGPTLLSGGSPTGGAYSGITVTGTSGQYFFDPSVAGPGSHDITYTFVDNNTCSNFDVKSLLVKNCVGIEEAGDDAALIFYPNPTNGLVNVSIPESLEGDIKYWVHNLNGQIVFSPQEYTLTNNRNLEIDLAYLANGVYFIQLQVGKEMYKQKVILEKN